MSERRETARIIQPRKTEERQNKTNGNGNPVHVVSSIIMHKQACCFSSTFGLPPTQPPVMLVLSADSSTNHLVMIGDKLAQRAVWPNSRGAAVVKKRLTVPPGNLGGGCCDESSTIQLANRLKLCCFARAGPSIMRHT